MPIRSIHSMLLLTFGMIASSAIAAEVRIKDITTVDGARSNQLYGTGLVFGLNGTGGRSLATQQLAIDMLKKLEQSTKLQRQSQLDNVFRSTSISQVMVTSELPAFSRKGSKVDVVVSTLDDATSLEGGTLILTPLRGADGEVYAVSQGNVSIGGFRVRSNTPNSQMNHPTNGRIPGGAIIEREALGEIDQGGMVRLLLRDADYANAMLITKEINTRYPAHASIVDGGTVQIMIPIPFRRNAAGFANELGQLKITPDSPARVVINERTGTVVVGHNVRISAVAIAHGNLTIRPSMAPAASGPAGLTNLSKDLATLPNAGQKRDKVDDILDEINPRRNQANPQPGPPVLHEVEQTFTVDELARVLNAVGVSPRDLIAIFQALKESGAMHAELISI